MTGTNLPVIMRVFNPHRDPELCELRGGPFFKMLADGGATIRELEDDWTIQLGPGIMIIDGANLAHGVMADEWREKYGDRAKVIVDVHFPLTDPELILAFQPDKNDKTRNREADQAAIDFWTNQDNRDRAFEILEGADAVTCPRPGWAYGLEHFNANVFVLPDVKDPKTGAQFAVGWLRALSAALGQRPPSIFKRWWIGLLARKALSDDWNKQEGKWKE